MTVTIRTFQEKDRFALQHLFLQVRKETFVWLNTGNYQLADFDEETNSEIILITEANKAIVGFISVWLPNRLIHHLYIAKAWQYKGIGTMLLKAVTTKLVKPVLIYCWKNNLPAITFYKKKWLRRKNYKHNRRRIIYYF